MKVAAGPPGGFLRKKAFSSTARDKTIAPTNEETIRMESPRAISRTGVRVKSTMRLVSTSGVTAIAYRSEWEKSR
jgi:hypothetical protein